MESVQVVCGNRSSRRDNNSSARRARDRKGQIKYRPKERSALSIPPPATPRAVHVSHLRRSDQRPYHYPSGWSPRISLSFQRIESHGQARVELLAKVILPGVKDMEGLRFPLPASLPALLGQGELDNPKLDFTVHSRVGEGGKVLSLDHVRFD